ncbi:TetR/AcrR family transcriptional regulator [Herbiconiux sp. VKM Ac-1786]|uniref:TetR/AcrR family transcriptional regulator n=1 Tax=Herbiconiux sp. VKM Ac-1786 TaxID=2783824 RepID=UPI00188D0340|nr:TetR/AcrR family transcriptional regulator [Herbiconiux sp. VKM Ac-1786]MBF4571792.1 TetR/AcrR family transcriptional regulator [Herbiconiux sp. VKM Ac-1786]
MTAETDVRERVLDAADSLFYSRGFSAVGMDEVRDAAGVSLRRLYSAFPSKESIVLAMLERRHEQWTTELRAVVDSRDDPRARILAVYDYLSAWFADESFRGCGFINAFGELGGVSPAVTSLIRAHKQSFQDEMARLADEAGAPPPLAPQLAILAEGAQTTAAIAGDPLAAGHARAAAEILVDAALA